MFGRMQKQEQLGLIRPPRVTGSENRVCYPQPENINPKPCSFDPSPMMLGSAQAYMQFYDAFAHYFSSGGGKDAESADVETEPEDVVEVLHQYSNWA